MDKKTVVCASSALGRDMHVNVYGKKGLPVIAFPTLAAAPESLEEAGVIDELADYLDSGTIQLFCTQTVDDESWAAEGDPADRAQRQEQFYHYVADELVPLVHKVTRRKARPLALGFDMGATHAAIALLRRPDLFQGCMSLSGSYDARRYFGEWMDATLYDNAPCAFLPHMAPDHPYVAVYNQRQLLFCTGQDASEADSLRTTREIDGELRRLGVDAWCDYWGGDVTHTWPWWKKQLRYFLPIVLDDVEKTTAAEKPARKRVATRKKADAVSAEKPAAKAAAKPAAKKAEPAVKTAAKPAEKAATKTAAKTAAKPTAAKAVAKAEEPAAKKAEPAKPAAKSAPAAKKAAPAAKPAAKAAPAKAEAKKPAAKTAAAKPATKPAAKSAAAKPAAKPTTTKPAASKPAAKPAAEKKPAAKPAAAKPATKPAPKGGASAK
ncbi:MAG TPA: hypothetical protein IAA39_08535 [Candidatus Olsenella avistercoris]|nr:hypothetical protein [Candidatus Olsenella avistercoris]